ncbi:hypothetical protein [Leucobacter soli]|uniref:hypothetical protein n=1 Tax=Leucobacter soli TaxID=2812850 RepID=UPI0036087BAE
MLNSKTDSPRIPQRLPQRGAAFLTAIAVGVGGLLVAPAGAHAEPTPVIEGLEGEGTAEAPLILDSAADLDLAAEAVNGDYASFGSLNYRLDADIDYGGGTFDAFARFSGSSTATATRSATSSTPRTWPGTSSSSRSSSS